MSTGSGARRRSASLKARLADRQRPSIAYPLLVDYDRHAAAVGALDDAVRDWRQVLLRDVDDAIVRTVVTDAADADGDDGSALAAAKAKVDQAQAAVDDCYETIVLRAMPPAAYERLIAAHPPTPEQRAEDPPQIWDPVTFRPALLAACADGDMTADDWLEFLNERCSAAERQGLYVAALAVNEQERVAEPLTLPKGSTRMRN